MALDTEIKVELARLTEQVAQIGVTVASLDEKMDKHLEESADIRTRLALVESEVAHLKDQRKNRGKLEATVIAGLVVGIIIAALPHFVRFGGG